MFEAAVDLIAGRFMLEEGMDETNSGLIQYLLSTADTVERQASAAGALTYIAVHDSVDG